ncbi:MAG: ATP-binding protein [Bryobacteraceae bacterium]
MSPLTVFLVHAAADAAAAAELAGFLERGARVQPLVTEGRIGPEDTLVSKMEEAQTADVIMAMLSPGSVCDPWRREEWVPVFQDQPREAGIEVGIVLARSAKFPDLLRRKNFFDLTADAAAARRAMKRWLLSLRPPARTAAFAPGKLPHLKGRDREMDALRGALADAPGCAVLVGAGRAGKTALALEFARLHEEDFEWLVWLSCKARSIEEIAGGLADQFDLRLEGELASNLAELRRIAAESRCLIVLDGADEPELAHLSPGGHASLLVTTTREDVAAAFPGAHIEIGERGEFLEMASLGEIERLLLAAIAACPAGGFDPEIAAEVAGLFDPADWRAALETLRAGGWVWEMDRNAGRLWMSSGVPFGADDRAMDDAHARAVARRAGSWSSLAEPQRLLAHLMHAIGRLAQNGEERSRTWGWGLANLDDEVWDMVCRLGQAAVAIDRHCGRLAEALPLLGKLGQAARDRGDRRTVETCLWEEAWILEAWGYGEEAEALRQERGRDFADQMTFSF